MSVNQKVENQVICYEKKHEKGGRPRLYEKKRTRMIMCWVNDEEFNEINKKCAEQNLTRGAYMRKSIFNQIVSKYDKQALTLYSNATNNLNQIALKLNSIPAHNLNAASIMCKDELQNIKKILNGLYKNIMGDNYEGEKDERE